MIKNKKSLFAALLIVFSLMAPEVASATPQLNQAGIRLGRLAESASSGNDLFVSFKLNTTPTSVSKITITFPTGFTVATASPSVVTTNRPNSPATTATPGTLTAASTGGGAGSGGTIVVSGLTSGSLNSTTLYGFTVASGVITNPATPGQYNPTVESDDSGGTPIDVTTTPTYIYGASANQDQIGVTASVAPNFTFQLSANADSVPQVDSSTVKTSGGVTMTVATDSPLGYTAYVKSANASLNSATSPATPIATGTFDGTPDSFVAGSTKYGFVPSTGTACSTCTGSISYDAEYAGLDAAHAGAFNTAGNFASFVSRSGYTNSDQISLKERVTVANTVGYANDYTDTLTIVAAGNY
ncbi:MAG: hypothetical protein JWO41_492 [Candidatus Saccharibacteria bacterium]|nr:hypothetical protein [Candidatus Saccharibacteria bacterium]